MLKKRYALLAVIATLIVATAVSVVPSFAQTTQPNRCYGLSASDCQLAESNLSLAGLRKLSSFNAAYEFEVKANDNAQINFDFAVKGNASVAIKPESILQLVAGGPNAILDSLALDTTLSGNHTNGSNNQTFSGELRLINGTVYVQSPRLANGQWQSLNLATLSQRPTLRPFGGAFNFRQMASLIPDWQKLLATPGAITATRGTDITIDNQTVAVFTYTIDLPTLFSSPQFPVLLSALAKARGQGNVPSSDELTLLSQQLATAFKGSTFTLTRMIGTQDKLPYGGGYDLSASIDPQTISLFPGGGAPGKTGSPVAIMLHFKVQLSGIGSVVSVNVPPNAQPINLGSAAATPEATAVATSQPIAPATPEATQAATANAAS